MPAQMILEGLGHIGTINLWGVIQRILFVLAKGFTHLGAFKMFLTKRLGNFYFLGILMWWQWQ